MTSPHVSVIIPAYNEEDLIASTLDCLHTYLSKRSEEYEIIVVDDGSRDRTVESVQAWQKNNPAGLRLLVNPRNMGKGFSIRRGVLESRGSFIIFIDADLPYELDAIDDFLKALGNGYDLAIGSRVLPGSQVKGVPVLRFVSGQIFSWMVQVVLFPGLPDTQCGFKSFKSAAAKEIFQRSTIGGFGFDVEMLYVARKRKLAIQPVAVRMIDHRHRSRVRLIIDSFKMFANLFMVRWNDLQGRYE
ncbi:MAG TPA: dolichyl-phosphate beta-glucosyltransferase [Anaerolineales bacterium]|nr:dolichyl-phosphate beta-glucosyltransferase [Anaerolineales bacterium]